MQKHALREQARAEEEAPETVAPVGSYVEVTLPLPAAFPARYGTAGGAAVSGAAAQLDRPLVVCGVSLYEDRMSVVHFSLSLTAMAEAAQVRGDETAEKQEWTRRSSAPLLRAAHCPSEPLTKL